MLLRDAKQTPRKAGFTLNELSVNKLNFLQYQGIHYVYGDFGCDRPLKEMEKVEIALNPGYRWAIQLAISITWKSV